MHQSTTRKVRKRILFLAAAALLLAPSLSLPTAKAETTSVSGTVITADPAQPAPPASSPAPQTPAAAVPAPQTGIPTPPAAGPESPDGVSSASEEPVEFIGERPADWTPEQDEMPADPEPPADPATAAPVPTQPGTPTKPGTPAKPPVPAAPDPFYDIVKDPNREAILTLYNEKIVKPSKDRKFRPLAEIGRADFTVILGRSMNANGSIFDVYFTDPIPDWAIRYVGGLSAAGIFDGYLEGEIFGAKKPVTRAEAAAMVARAAHLESQPLPEGLGGVGNIPTWALDDVGAAYAAGLIEATNTGTLNPNKKVTRSEMAAMIAPLLEADAFLTPFEVEEDITLP
ncbi:S-layer homology domain-containing protein [Saccharibacillus deserti]|uniref:S-layer homology domain-containing protein n=1 Tax=Saccharibacillus deserti TaxID=1634444 RepID=UPI001553FF45|nr:S-layer homology domain-containing protein [Saccharibacillus deserti]